MGILPSEDRPKELELFTMEKKKLHGEPVATFQRLKAAYKKSWRATFCSDR